jgi:hypothetical protein
MKKFNGSMDFAYSVVTHCAPPLLAVTCPDLVQNGIDFIGPFDLPTRSMNAVVVGADVNNVQLAN